MQYNSNAFTASTVFDRSKIVGGYFYTYGIQPSSVFEQSMQVYKISDEHSGLSILEQLYTARGAQGFACLKDFLEPE